MKYVLTILAAAVVVIAALAYASNIGERHSVPPTSYGTVEGRVTLGPTCPVERIPPDPRCADNPYQTSIVVRDIHSGASMTIATDVAGAFTTKLAPSAYLFTAGSDKPLPRCAPQQIVVSPNQTQMITISCDTGIR